MSSEPTDDDIRLEAARLLLKMGVINFRPNDPFVLTSGRLSPVYVDCRKIISFPQERQQLMSFLVIKHLRDRQRPVDVVAGGETAGIAYSAFVAERMDLPMIYIRKKPKEFGKLSQIEGVLAPGSTVLLVEDMATDGKSKLMFADAIRAAGANILDVSVIFFYDIFAGSREILLENGINLSYLTTWASVMEVARRSSHLPSDELDEVDNYLSSPTSWTPAAR